MYSSQINFNATVSLLFLCITWHPTILLPFCNYNWRKFLLFWLTRSIFSSKRFLLIIGFISKRAFLFTAMGKVLFFFIRDCKNKPHKLIRNLVSLKTNVITNFMFDNRYLMHFLLKQIKCLWNHDYTLMHLNNFFLLYSFKKSRCYTRLQGAQKFWQVHRQINFLLIYFSELVLIDLACIDFLYLYWYAKKWSISIDFSMLN